MFSPVSSGSTFCSLWTSSAWHQLDEQPLLLSGRGNPGERCKNILKRGSTRWWYLEHGSSGNIATLAFLMDLLQIFRLRSRPSKMKRTYGLQQALKTLLVWNLWGPPSLGLPSRSGLYFVYAYVTVLTSINISSPLWSKVGRDFCNWIFLLLNTMMHSSPVYSREKKCAKLPYLHGIKYMIYENTDIGLKYCNTQAVTRGIQHA